MEEHADQRLTTPVFVQITSLAYFVRQKYVIQNVKIILTAPTVLVSAILDLLEKTVMNVSNYRNVYNYFYHTVLNKYIRIWKQFI